jgi:hypothetical protein
MPLVLCLRNLDMAETNNETLESADETRIHLCIRPLFTRFFYLLQNFHGGNKGPGGFIV